MPALLVLNYSVHDEAALAAYRQEAAGVMLAGTARLVTTTSQTRHLAEIAQPGGTHTVVLWFRSPVEALRRYESKDYQDLIGKRLAATTPHAAFVVDVTDPSVLSTGGV